MVIEIQKVKLQLSEMMTEKLLQTVTQQLNAIVTLLQSL